ncbi:tryptophan synthase subunit alpha [Gaopeijia maritima]|uniref:Tryptophan synthase alpha chain n=1 Tax=Gaopeijia maritima TaxID=3119007 RepID=A0ABU9E8C2_9BACT
MTSSRIARRFAERAAEGRSVLVPYVTAGFPEADTTTALLPALAEAGADVIEVGIPFSDPLADGPTIQDSSFRALENGTTVARVLDFVREFRREHDTPVVLFTYLNPVYHYGLDAFCRDAAEAGADGVLLTDLPAGADPELEGAFERHGLDAIRLLAPTTADSRIGEVAAGGRGFLYYISRTGVTGARADLPPELEAEVRRIRDRVGLPVAVGFGISTPEQARAVAHLADGVVVGSALVRRLDEAGVEGARAFVASLREAMDADR